MRLHPLLLTYLSPIRWRTYIAQACAMMFIFALIVPGFKAIGNIGFYGMMLSWLWGIGQQGLKATMQSTSVVAWLGFTLFLWIVLALGKNGSVSDDWRLFFHYTSLGKALIAGVCMANCHWSTRSFTYLYKMLLLLLLIMNLRQMYLMWHFQVLFNFTGQPYEVLWQMRDCGQYIILFFPFLFLALSTTQHKGIRGLLICWSMIELILLLGTGLRGAYLGFIVALVIWLGFSYRQRFIVALLLGLALIYASVMLFLPHDNIIYQAFKRGGNDSHRIELVWKPTLSIIKEAPIFGHGFGQQNFMDVYRKYQARHPDWTFSDLPDPHNVALSVGFSAGIPAIVLYMCLFIAGLVTLGQQCRPLQRQDKMALFPLAVLCSWVALLGVLGQTDIVRWEYFAVLLTLIAICSAVRRHP